MNWFTRVAFALGILLTPFSAAGQASNAIPISGGPVVTPYNTPAINAPVRVCAVTAIGNPCSTAGVTLYSDYNLTHPINNPTATNSHGVYNAFTVDGFYLIQIQVTPTLTYSYYYLSGTGGSGGGLSYTSPALNYIPRVTSAISPGVLGNSACSDNGTLFSCTEQINGTGYEVSGSPLATGNLSDWSNSGIANGDCPVWNSGTGKWTPGSCSTGSGVALSTNGVSNSSQSALNFITSTVNADGLTITPSNPGGGGNEKFEITGTVNATQINGATVPASASVLASNSSSQLIAAGTTGSGNVVLATSPTLVTPALGTPVSGVITNLTGTCASCTANSATNLAGGATYGIPYQSGVGTTTFLTEVNNAVLVTSGSGLPSESTTLPTGLALQTPASGVITNLTGTCTSCNIGGNSATTSAISGQANGVIPLATASNIIGAQSHLSDNGTDVTSSLPVVVSGSIHGVTISAGTQVSPVAGSVIYGSDSGSTGNAMVSEAGAAYSRICTAANSSGVSGCGSGGGTPAYPLTITGGVSGGVVYGSSGTQLTVSPAGTANVLMKWGGAATAPQNSSVTDNATTVTTTDTGGYVAPVFVANGTTAGFMDYPQGSDSGSVAPCNTATSICEEAPTSVTSYKVIKHGAAATGFLLRTNSSNVETETVVGTTGSGNVVLATSPTLVTPALGTPASGVITNLTGTCTSCSSTNTTNLLGGATYAIPYQLGVGSTSFFAAVDNAVVVTSSSGLPSESTTLPSGLTIPSATLTGVTTASAIVAGGTQTVGVAVVGGSGTCAISSTIGGAWAGGFTITATGSPTCGVTITLPAAAHGWTCNANSVAGSGSGLPGIVFGDSSYTTTTAVIDINFDVYVSPWVATYSCAGF